MNILFINTLYLHEYFLLLLITVHEFIYFFTSMAFTNMTRCVGCLGTGILCTVRVVPNEANVFLLSVHGLFV